MHPDLSVFDLVYEIRKALEVAGYVIEIEEPLLKVSRFQSDVKTVSEVSLLTSVALSKLLGRDVNWLSSGHFKHSENLLTKDMNQSVKVLDKEYYPILIDTQYKLEAVAAVVCKRLLPRSQYVELQSIGVQIGNFAYGYYDKGGDFRLTTSYEMERSLANLQYLLAQNSRILEPDYDKFNEFEEQRVWLREQALNSVNSLKVKIEAVKP